MASAEWVCVAGRGIWQDSREAGSDWNQLGLAVSSGIGARVCGEHSGGWGAGGIQGDDKLSLSRCLSGGTVGTASAASVSRAAWPLERFRKHFFAIRCLSIMRWAEGAVPSSSHRGGRKIPARLVTGQNLETATPSRKPARFRRVSVHVYERGLSFCRIRCLVTMGRAFYNPPNTALDIVGMSIRRRVSKLQNKRVGRSASECLRNHSTSASPRSTE